MFCQDKFQVKETSTVENTVKIEHLKQTSNWQ